MASSANYVSPSKQVRRMRLNRLLDLCRSDLNLVSRETLRLDSRPQRYKAGAYK